MDLVKIQPVVKEMSFEVIFDNCETTHDMQ